MGLYLNTFGTYSGPMEWLKANGTKLEGPPEFNQYGDSMVVAVPQREYPAVGVMFSQAELDRWTIASAERPTWWYLVPARHLRAVLPEIDAWIAIGSELLKEEKKMPKGRNRTGAMVTHLETLRLGEVWDVVKKHEKRTGAGLVEECREYLVIWHAVGRRSTLCEILNPSGGRVSLGIAHRGRPCDRCGQGGDKANEDLGKRLSLWRAIKNAAEWSA